LQWSEESLNSLFKLLAKRQATQYLEVFLRSRTTLSLFRAMSHQYRYSFIESLLGAKAEILLEINDLLQHYNKSRTQSATKAAHHFGDISGIGMLSGLHSGDYQQNDLDDSFNPE